LTFFRDKLPKESEMWNRHNYTKYADSKEAKQLDQGFKEPEIRPQVVTITGSGPLCSKLLKDIETAEFEHEMNTRFRRQSEHGEESEEEFFDLRKHPQFNTMLPIPTQSQENVERVIRNATEDILSDMMADLHQQAADYDDDSDWEPSLESPIERNVLDNRSQSIPQPIPLSESRFKEVIEDLSIDGKAHLQDDEERVIKWNLSHSDKTEVMKFVKRIRNELIPIIFNVWRSGQSFITLERDEVQKLENGNVLITSLSGLKIACSREYPHCFKFHWCGRKSDVLEWVD
jgi:hypothetical protein